MLNFLRIHVIWTSSRPRQPIPRRSFHGISTALEWSVKAPPFAFPSRSEVRPGSRARSTHVPSSLRRRGTLPWAAPMSNWPSEVRRQKRHSPVIWHGTRDMPGATSGNSSPRTARGTVASSICCSSSRGTCAAHSARIHRRKRLSSAMPKRMWIPQHNARRSGGLGHCRLAGDRPAGRRPYPNSATEFDPFLMPRPVEPPTMPGETRNPQTEA